jgi:uncharacterized protein
MRIFLDANVLFSAAQSDGGVRRLLGLMRERSHVGVVDAYVVAEARRNVAAKAVLRNASAVQDVEGLLAGLEMSLSHAQPLSPEQKALADWLPDKDRPVLWAAMALGCDALVTGDKTHFSAGYGQHFADVLILSPAMLAAKLLSFGSKTV